MSLRRERRLLSLSFKTSSFVSNVNNNDKDVSLSVFDSGDSDPPPIQILDTEFDIDVYAFHIQDTQVGCSILHHRLDWRPKILEEDRVQ